MYFYLKCFYNFVTLNDVLDGIVQGKKLPPNSAVVTFDDGYRNNLDCALPILKRYNIPATIFLTSGYINSDRILPMDLTYLIISRARNKNPYPLPDTENEFLYFNDLTELTESYNKLVSILKKKTSEEQRNYLGIVSNDLDIKYRDNQKDFNDFSLLNWDEASILMQSELILRHLFHYFYSFHDRHI